MPWESPPLVNTAIPLPLWEPRSMKRWCVGSAIIPLVVLVGGIRDKLGSGTLWFHTFRDYFCTANCRVFFRLSPDGTLDPASILITPINSLIFSCLKPAEFQPAKWLPLLSDRSTNFQGDLSRDVINKSDFWRFLCNSNCKHKNC